MIVALAGGIGASKFLRGLVRAVPPEDVTVIVNTADDVEVHGLWVSPDADTITYSLAGAANKEQGWGLEGESWSCADALGRYGMPTWFQLGDRDLATHLFRTQRRREGARATTIAAEIAGAWGVESRILPMTDGAVTNTTVVEGEDGVEDLHFQEYLIARHMADPVVDVRYEGVDRAEPTAEVLDALAAARGLIFCPSNPVVSIGPILALDGVREAIAQRKVRAVGISPIIAGAPVRGPADPLMRAAGMDVSCAGVAAAYNGLIDTLVVDTADAGSADAVEAHGVGAVAAETLMSDVAIATELAHVVLANLDL